METSKSYLLSNEFKFQMYRSAAKSEILNQMTFIQNGIDEVRRTAYMTIDKANNGGSFVELSTDAKNGSKSVL